MGEHLFKRGRTWFGWAYDVAGKQVRFSTGCTDKAAARLVLAQRERQAKDPDTHAKNQAQLEDAFALLEEHRASLVASGIRSKATVDFYKCHAKAWYLFAGRTARGVKGPDAALADEERAALVELGRHVALADIGDERAVDAFVLYRRQNGVSESTIGKERTTFRAALRLAKRQRIWSGDLELLFPRGFETGYKPNKLFLSREQGQRLLDSFLSVPRGDGAENKGPQPHRRAFVAFLLATGADLGDVVRARREDIGPDLVHVRGTKNANRDRYVPIVTEWQRELLAYVEAHADGKDGLLFSSWSNVRRALALACERAGVPRVSPRRLRHTFAHWMKGEGIHNAELHVAMGHADTRMLDRVYGRTEGVELVEAMRGSIAERRAALRVIPGGKGRRKAC